jgi:hypothetical protein
MNDDVRRAKILEQIEKYTMENSASKTLAMSALIRTGVYTKKGKLKVEFGGDSKNKDAA